MRLTGIIAPSELADNGDKVPNTRVAALIKNTQMPVWFWRAPGPAMNTMTVAQAVVGHNTPPDLHAWLQLQRLASTGRHAVASEPAASR